MGAGNHLGCDFGDARQDVQDLRNAVQRLSQAASFGDEYETATNYPLVRITNNSTGRVFYARTHNHSTMGVATGSKIVSTSFDVPATMETGASSLVVVANGIPSIPVSITVN